MSTWEAILNLLMTLVVIFAIALGIYLIAESIDQSVTEPEFAGYALVTNKEAGTHRYFIMVGKVLVPQQRDYWKITFLFNNQQMTVEVNETCYNQVEQGYEIGINVKNGLFSTHYYPICT